MTECYKCGTTKNIAKYINNKKSPTPVIKYICNDCRDKTISKAVYCCYCGEKNSIRKSGYTTSNVGKHRVQQYYCNACSKNFTSHSRKYMECADDDLDGYEKRQKNVSILWKMINMSMIANLEEFSESEWVWG